jgi:hypothetical protein
MSFINKSVNYSQTNLLKTNFLSKCLEKVNSQIYQLQKKKIPSMTYHIIPNNGKKYYAFITDGSAAGAAAGGGAGGPGGSGGRCNLMYLFPDSQTLKNNEDNKKEINHLTDFFMELDQRFTKDYLLEGYLYKSDDLYNRYTYLISDLLYVGESAVEFDYTSRYVMLNEMISSIPKTLRYMNDHMTIGIHPVFTSDNENIVKIFMNNFIFKKEITCIEHVHPPFTKKLFKAQQKANIAPAQKKITRSQYPDVYNVYHLESGDSEGILYVKGVDDSKYIKGLFKDSGNVMIIGLCKYNTQFDKWQLVREAL